MYNLSQSHHRFMWQGRWWYVLRIYNVLNIEAQTMTAHTMNASIRLIYKQCVG
jgi:hypothetical protein